MDGSNKKIFLVIMGILFIFYIFRDNTDSGNSITDVLFKDNEFNIIASTSTRMMDSDIISYGKKNNININIEHYGDLEIVDILNSDSNRYDAVWISNSMWLYMLNNSYLTSDSKSIAISPVVMGVEKSKAIELGLVNKDVYNRDILNSIRDGKLKYVMASVTQTNTGATSYLSFLNSLAGSPEVLTSDMLKNNNLITDLKELFKGVERVSGDEDYLSKMFLNGEYNAMINYESSLIELNKELIKKGKEPLYLIYPVDGVSINDMPFAYINNDKNDTDKKNKFYLIQKYLRSDDSIKRMEELGYRSWYGGVKDNTDKKVFNPDWGIDTNRYLKDMKYPSKGVINEAMDLYIEELRKPTHVVFCLDVSGSMYGNGLNELKEGISYILDYESAKKDKLQFSDNDKITIISFNGDVKDVYPTRYGKDTKDVINDINNLVASGVTNIYSPSIKALDILKASDSREYTKTIILMTDGYSNRGSFSELKNYYKKNKFDVPIYGITFGSSDDSQLNEIAELSNGKVFDGKSGLSKAFREVRSYN